MGAEPPRWTIKRGADFFRSFRLRQTRTSQPLDLTGWQFWSQIREHPGAALITDITCSVDGDTLTLHLPYSTTANLPLGPNNTSLSVQVDIIAQRQDGTRFSLLETKATIQGSITEAPAP